jgi:hypothetical protein
MQERIKYVFAPQGILHPSEIFPAHLSRFEATPSRGHTPARHRVAAWDMLVVPR